MLQTFRTSYFQRNNVNTKDLNWRRYKHFAVTVFGSFNHSACIIKLLIAMNWCKSKKFRNVSRSSTVSFWFSLSPVICNLKQKMDRIRKLKVSCLDRPRGWHMPYRGTAPVGMCCFRMLGCQTSVLTDVGKFYGTQTRGKHFTGVHKKPIGLRFHKWRNKTAKNGHWHALPWSLPASLWDERNIYIL